MGVGLVIGVWIARYLGPQQFGLWNYAIAFATLFGAFANLGLDGIAVRELAKTPERRDVLLGSAFVLKLLGSVFAVLIAVFSIALIRKGEALTIWLVGLSAGGFIFQSLNVIDFYYQSKVKSKYSVIATNSAFVLMTVIKIALLVKSAPLIFFACAGLCEIALGGLFLCVAYKLDHNEIRSWRYDSQIARALLKDSWPLVFSGFALMIQAKIDQVMLGNMISNEEVGQYSAAMRLIEVFGFVPMIIASTLAPYIARAKMNSETLYYKRLFEVYRLMFITFLLVAIPVFLFGDRIVTLLYGTDYKRAGVLLSLFAIRLFFANFGVGKSLFITNESLFRYALMTGIIGATVNIVGNYFLIPRYHSEGAIIATIISFSVNTFVIDIFYSATRVNLKLMIRAVFVPWKFHNNRDR
jgi:O-antigen/teichoic acid export membrane protein